MYNTCDRSPMKKSIIYVLPIDPIDRHVSENCLFDGEIFVDNIALYVMLIYIMQSDMRNSLDGLEVSVLEQYTQENYQISDGLIEYIGRFH